MSQAAACTRTASFNKLRSSDIPPERARGLVDKKEKGGTSRDVRGCRCFSLHQLCLVTLSAPRHTASQPASQRQLQRQPRTAANVEVMCALLPTTTRSGSLFGLM